MASTAKLFTPARVTQALSHPDAGPRIVFFSGGSALKETSQALVRYTHRSVHLVTPFDSGGSSAALRRYFAMPAVGDLRCRLMALADHSWAGVAELHDVLAYRLPRNANTVHNQQELCALARGEHPLMIRITEALRSAVCPFVQYFAQAIGQDFDLRGASVGNMVLAAGYMQHERCFEPIVSLFSSLMQVRGHVQLIAPCDLHLRALLRNGKELIGQHRITGKEEPPLTVPIAQLSLVDPARPDLSVRPCIDAPAAQRICQADLICYPMGSFYSSVIANLIPAGVGQAIALASCPKIFVPNPTPDPESIGLTLEDQVRILVHYLRMDRPEQIAVRDVVHGVLLDETASYPGAHTMRSRLKDLGIEVMTARLLDHDQGKIHPERLCQALISLVQRSPGT